jgi:hypothetical protein
MSASNARTGGALLLVTACGVLGPLAIFACSSDSTGDDSTNPAGEGGADGEPLFRIVQHDLIVRCGGPNGSCHVRGELAPHWLGDPDPYLSAKKYPGILPATHDPGDSTLLTQVAHTGPSLKSFPELYDHVATWISAELPKPPLPNTGAFSVATGLNVVNLNTIGSGLDGARITFLANDGSAGTLSLTALRVQAPQSSNLKFDGPFFVILPRNGKVKAQPDVNGFQGELTVPAGTSVDFYTGKMILTGWDSNGQLKIAFNKLEATPGKGPSGGCTALDAFMTKALPAMRTQINITGDDDNEGGTFDAAVIGQGSCIGCHGKPTDPTMGPTTAVSAMDLTAADTDPAKACAQARNYINFQNRAQSTILLNPEGKANPNHPVAPLADTDPVVTGIAAWVNAEQP